MMQVKEAMIHRDQLITTSPSITVEEAMKILVVDKIGSIVIIDEDDNVTGIITSRDLMNAVSTFGSEGLSKSISEIMSVHLLVVNENDTLKAAILKMEEYRIHHILVRSNGGEISGLLSSFDIVRESALDSLKI